MATATAVRIDTLVYDLKELQNEKQSLELKLKEQKSNVQALERKVSKCNMKLTHMQEMCQRLTGMKNVAVQKVQQTQQQVDSLQQLNQAQNSEVNELNSQLQQEKERASEIVKTFGVKMTALSENMRAARRLYKADELQERINTIADKIRKSEATAEADSAEVNNLSMTMDSLHLKPSGRRCWNIDVPMQVRLMIWDMLEQQEQQVQDSINRLHAEQQEICALLQESAASFTNHNQPTSLQ